jgi:protein involved in polysaccharide export with SLBB domain
MAVIAAALFGLGVLTSTGVTTTADGQAVADREKINRQLEQVVKALDSGDIAAAVEYLKETIQGLPTGETKTQVELGVAIDALQSSNDTKNARMHVQLVQGSLQNSTG